MGARSPPISQVLGLLVGGGLDRSESESEIDSSSSSSGSDSSDLPGRSSCARVLRWHAVTSGWRNCSLTTPAAPPRQRAARNTPDPM